MTLAIYITDGRGLSNKVRHELLLKKGNAVLAVHFTVTVKADQLYITNKTECFSFKSGCAV